MNARTPPPPPAASRVDVHAYTRQSRTYEPDDPDLKKKRVRKFRLEELQRVPREHRDLYRALQHLLPEALFEPGFLGTVRQTINQVTQIDLDLWLHSVRVLKRTEMRAMIPGSTFLAVIGLAPLSEKLLLELDLRFVYRAIDRLLGGHGVAVDIQRPLTEIEQGVFSYLLLKVLLLFQGQITAPDQIAIRLDDMRNDLKSAADIVRHDDFWICVSLKMNFDLDVGYARVLVPSGLAKRISPGRPPAGTALFERWNARIRERMARLNGATVDAVIDIGRIELTSEDLRNLDPGDIILLENTQARLDGENVAGIANMTLGLGRQGIIYGNLAAQGTQLVFEVTQIEINETPAPHDPQEVHGEHGNPEEVIAEYEDGSEPDDGHSDPDEDLDEDYGIDDENEGEDEDVEGYQEEEQEEQVDDEQHAGEEELPIDDDDNLAEAGPLLGDIPINVVVELGRVQLTADEVIRLRAGQLLELGRSPSDPVDLVVNGKLLAKGELVEIEGALGVKILSLLKEGQ